MRFAKTAMFLQLICIVGIYGAAVHDKETNAARFRRGLEPLPPTRRPPLPAPDFPMCSNVGTLQIRRLSNGERIGYLGKRFNRDNAYTVRLRPRAALRVTVLPITPFGMVINLIAANAPDSGHPYLGWVDAGHGHPRRCRSRIRDFFRHERSWNEQPAILGCWHEFDVAAWWDREPNLEDELQTRQITAQWTNTGGGERPETSLSFGS
ncbi:hypothetical protein B0H14DRAFT_2629858 [Mycena olivaceomarginata]|nr:hypothetical protein B0H14DRAFT_2629858 [Mycena olivaceomarginata]